MPISITSGIVQHPLGHRLATSGRQRRGKEKGLAIFRAAFDDLSDLREKTHVEHAIHFIEHEILDGLEIDVALAHQIDQPARGGNEHIDAALQHLPLRPKAHAPLDEPDLDVHEARKVAKSRLDLGRELARGFQDQAAKPAVFLEHGEKRQSESGRLARSRLGGAHDILAFEHEWDGAQLDGSGIDITHRLHPMDDRVDESKFLK